MNLQAWLTEVGKWWQGLTTSQREVLIVATVIVGALIVGKIAGTIVKSLVKSFGLDEVLRFPLAQKPSRANKTPSDAVGYLCVLTVWAGFAWWLMVRHQLTDIANAIRFALGRVWILAVIVGLSVGFANWLIKLLLDFLRGQAARELTEKFSLQMREHFSEAIVRACALLVYAFLLLLALTVTADLFGMATTASAIKLLWELSLKLIIAAIALGVGWLGIQWLEKWVKFAEVEQSPFNLISFLVRSGVVGASLLLVLILLTGSQSVLIALLLVAVLAFFLAPLREYIPDIWSGWMLKLHNVREVEINGEPMKLERIGMLASELKADSVESVKVVKNHKILQTFLKRESHKELVS